MRRAAAFYSREKPGTVFSAAPRDKARDPARALGLRNGGLYMAG